MPVLQPTPGADGGPPPPPTGWRSWLLDVGLLRRHRDFRLVFTSRAVSLAGTQLTALAVPYQVFRLTHSTLAVGLIGLAMLGPLLGTALVGGLLADLHDRRRLVVVTEVSLALCSAALLANAAVPRPALWPLYVVAGASAALEGLQRPPLDALVPQLVPAAEIAAAMTLETIGGTAGTLVVPAVGGVVIAAVGLPVAYAVDVLSFAASLAALLRIRPVPPVRAEGRPGPVALLAGVRYAARRPVLIGTYTADVVAMLWATPLAVLPALAVGWGGATALGLLYAAPGAGAVLVAAAGGWVQRVRRQGLAVLVAAGLTCLAVAGLGVAPSLVAALAFLAAAGAADEVSGIFRSTIWNQTVPTELRGRVAGVELISFSAGPLLGQLRVGAMAAVLGLPAALLGGGLVGVVGVAAVGWRLPALAAHRADPGATRPPGLRPGG